MFTPRRPGKSLDVPCRRVPLPEDRPQLLLGVPVGDRNVRFSGHAMPAPTAKRENHRSAVRGQRLEYAAGLVVRAQLVRVEGDREA